MREDATKKKADQEKQLRLDSLNTRNPHSEVLLKNRRKSDARRSVYDRLYESGGSLLSDKPNSR